MALCELIHANRLVCVNRCRVPALNPIRANRSDAMYIVLFFCEWICTNLFARIAQIRVANCRAIYQKNPCAHKNRIGTPPPPKTQNTPPLKRGILWAWVFPAERKHFSRGPYIGTAISGPRIAGKTFYGHEIFLNLRLLSPRRLEPPLGNDHVQGGPTSVR